MCTGYGAVPVLTDVPEPVCPADGAAMRQPPAAAGMTVIEVS